MCNSHNLSYEYFSGANSVRDSNLKLKNYLTVANLGSAPSLWNVSLLGMFATLLGVTVDRWSKTNFSLQPIPICLRWDGGVNLSHKRRNMTTGNYQVVLYHMLCVLSYKSLKKKNFSIN